MKTKEITFTFYPNDYMSHLSGKWSCHQWDNDGETTFGSGDTELSALENLIQQLDTDDLRVEDKPLHTDTARFKLQQIESIIRAHDNIDRDNTAFATTAGQAAAFQRIAEFLDGYRAKDAA